MCNTEQQDMIELNLKWSNREKLNVDQNKIDYIELLSCNECLLKAKELIKEAQGWNLNQTDLIKLDLINELIEQVRINIE